MIPNSDNGSGAQFKPHYLQELPSEDEQRLGKLFQQLDVNRDGRIDIHDLTQAFENLGLSHYHDHAEKFIERSDTAKSGDVDFAEFVHYIIEHEKRLSLMFHCLDENKDGKLDKLEIISSFKKLGINIDRNEAARLIQRIDKDGSLEIGFGEWRDYLLFHPSTELQDILHFWKHATYVDIGEDSLVPDDFTEIEMASGMWWRHLVAGAIAGSVSRTCTAPLDRLKVFLQVHGSRFSSISNCFFHMVKEGGTKSLWRGNGINVLKIAPETAFKFMAYEQIKQIIRGNMNRELRINERFVAGSIAGGISQTLIYPMEVLKTRLALRTTGQYSGIFDAAKNILKHEGALSFYRGYVPNLLGIIPYAGIDLAVYETLKKFYLQRHSKGDDPGVLVLLACGTTSSTCGQLASYPLALVKTRLQATNSEMNVKMFGIFKAIVQKEGFIGLYRGITPNFMKVAPAVSISYVVYEHIRKFLGVNMT